MPLYEYICENCGDEFEAIQKFSDPYLSHCKKCDKNTLVKKASLPSFQLKGGGWYNDGYSGNSNKKNDSNNISEKNTESTTKEKTENTSSKPADTTKAADKAKPAKTNDSGKPAKSA